MCVITGARRQFPAHRINRHSPIAPKTVFLAVSLSCFSASAGVKQYWPALEMTYEDFKEEVSVYLLPDELNNQNFWLQHNYKPILKQEIFSWCIDDSLWPSNLDYKTFKSFFKPRFFSMVVDLCGDDIQSESCQD